MMIFNPSNDYYFTYIYINSSFLEYNYLTRQNISVNEADKLPMEYKSNHLSFIETETVRDKINIDLISV